MSLIFSGKNNSVVYRKDRFDSYDHGYSSVDTVVSSDTGKLIMAPCSKINFDEGDDIILEIGGQIFYSGKVSEGQFVFEESYIDADGKIHDGIILQYINKLIAKGETPGLSTYTFDTKPVGESDDINWGLMYPGVEIQKDNIRETLKDILMDTDTISISTSCSRDGLSDWIRIDLYRESDSPDEASNNVYQVLTQAISLGLVSGKDELYITQASAEDKNCFVRLVVRPDYHGDGNCISIITRGDEFNDISDSLSDIVLKDESLNEYKIYFDEFINDPTNTDRFQDGDSGTLR